MHSLSMNVPCSSSLKFPYVGKQVAIVEVHLTIVRINLHCQLDVQTV